MQVTTLLEEVRQLEEEVCGILFHYEEWRFPQAHKRIRQALSFLGSKHPYTAVILKRLGKLLRLEGEFDQAEAVYRQALAMAEADNSYLPPEELPLKLRSGTFSLGAARLRTHVGILSPQAARMRQKLCKLFASRSPSGAREQVLGFYQEQIQRVENLPVMPDALELELAWWHWRQQEIVQAQSLAEQLLPQLERDSLSYPLAARFASSAAALLGECYRAMGWKEKAEEFHARSVQLLSPAA